MKISGAKKSLKFIDSWLELNYSTNEIPGFVVAISYKGKVIFNKAYGFANLEKQEKLTPSHIFRIASHSKTFTATAIMQLEEENKLKLDDFAVKYLPWLKKHNDKRFQKITIQNLLEHSAGVIRDGVDSDFWSLKRRFPTEDDFIKEILSTDLIFDNNSRLKYSNSGYTLLGLVIEKITGNSYNNYVKENIIKPLGLKNTGPEYEKSIDRKLATGYARLNKDKKRLPIDNVDTNIKSSATGFYSTSEDLCKYFNAQMIGSGKLLSDKSKKEMQKKRWKVKNIKEKEWYGRGLIVSEIEKVNYIGHSGGFPGYITNSMFEPEEKLIVSVLTNCIDGAATTILNGIISVVKEYIKNDAKKPKQDLSKFEGRFMGIWGNIDILAIGNKIFSVYPNSWTPFEETSRLRYINKNTLKIVKTNSYAAEGELVNYEFDKKESVKSIVYAGATFLPEKTYLKEEKNLKMIKLQKTI